MRTFLLLLTFIICLAPSQFSTAKTIELTSENFVLYSEGKEKDAAALLRDLELFRKNIFIVYGVTQRPELVPVHVYITKNDKSLKKITGTSGFSGQYTTTHNGPAFVLNGKKGFGRGAQARHIALHEYSHHIVAAYTNKNFPLWYNEGFSNYLATFTYKKGVFRIGDPYDPYGYTLSGKLWMPMTVVLATVHDYPFNIGDNSKVGLQTKHQFYAQTWLATHYLRNTPQYQKKIPDYINRLNRGEDSIKAFKAAFDMTPEDFESKLKAYFKANKYIVTQYESPAQDIPAFSARSLNDQQAALAKLSAMRNFIFNEVRATSVLAAYRAYEANYGESAQTLAARADITALYAKTKADYDAAKVLALRAVAQDPSNIEAHNIAALIMVHQYIRNLGSSEAEMKTARRHLAKVLKHDSQIPLANYSYALSYQGDYNPPDNALNAASYALDYYRGKSFMGPNLGLAGILVNGGKFDEALPVIEFIRIWSREPDMRIAAQSMKKYIKEETR